MNFLRRLNVYLIQNWPAFLFLLAVVAGYYQILFFQTTFKFDAIYNHLAWRQLIVDNLRHGNLPLWNYYHSLGTPIHADPQSGAWYPLVWFISLFGTYDLLTYNLEFVFHVALAGLGIQYLFKTLKMSPEAQFLASIAYVFSGFFAANSMFFTWIISAAWIPYIIAGFLVLWRNPSTKNAILTAFFIFMLLSGGYPAFTIILIYIVLGLFVYELTKKRNSNQESRRQVVLFTLLTISFAVLLSAVVLVSVAQVIPFMPRGAPASIDDAAIPPFLPQHFLSLILPYPFVELQYDESIRFDGTNIYLGLIVLLSITYVFFSKKVFKDTWLLLLSALLFFAIAFGRDYWPYNMAFNYLPGINFFRFPTLFRFFGMFALLIVFGKIFTEYQSINFRKTLFPAFTIVLILLILAIFRSASFPKPPGISTYDWVTHFTFWDKALLQSGFQFLILVIIGCTILFIKSQVHKMRVLLLVSALELIIAFNIYMPYTITSFKSNPIESNKVLYSKILDFNLESNKSIYLNSTYPDSTYLYSYFMFIYKKVVSDKGNTFELSDFRNLKISKPDLYNKLIDNPVFYIANDVYPQSLMDSICREKTKLTKTLFFPLSTVDTSNFEDDDSATLLLRNFDYNRIVLNTKTQKDKYLVFLQNHYYGWLALIDGASTEVIKANSAFMAIKIPKGDHEIVWQYFPGKVIFSLIVSFVSFVTLLIVFIGIFLRKQRIVKNLLNS